MSGNGNGTPLKAIQESAMEIYRNLMPALRRCSSFRHYRSGNVSERRASHQQADNLKWQQDMFLRLVNMNGLCREGLVSESDVATFRQKILDHVVVCYDGGEYPQVTRDKLLFLQELLYSRCISEDQYHSVKNSLLYRLAAQGAEINSSDIVLTCSSTAPPEPLGQATANNDTVNPKVEKDPLVSPKDETSDINSPVKHLLSRLMHNGKVHNESTRPSRVPHSVDFLKPDSGVRDLPEFDQCGSPLFHSPCGSVSSMESSSNQGATSTKERSQKEITATSTPPKKAWRLDMLRPPTLVHTKSPVKEEKTDANEPAVLSPITNSNRAKLKKKSQKGASSDFYIDKVLGENIKKELEHIRSEMSKTNTSQTFTNDQIDAIATRLPTDKTELMRFFPKAWCDRYGDGVLDVVDKEFKGHIKDMQTPKKTAKENPSKPSPVASTNRNKSTNRCIFMTSDENSSPRRAVTTPRKVTSFNSSSERLEKELDGKLCAEIEKLPHRKTPIRV